MDVFDFERERRNKMEIICSPVLDAEVQIKSIGGVLDVEVLPNGKGSYKAHVVIKPGAEQVLIFRRLKAIIQKYVGITDIKIWTEYFPADPVTSIKDYKAIMMAE